MKSNTIRIILAGVNDNDGAQLTSALRRAGYVARLESVSNITELEQALSSGRFDLLLVDSERANFDYGQCNELINKSGTDAALLAISDSAVDIAAHNHVADILSPGDPERIVRSCVREFQNRQLRRDMQALEEQLAAAEQRNAMLLSEADQAIAYIADGMIIDCNKSFAQRFGHDDAEELSCAPLIDCVAREDQDRLKNALKSQAQGKEKTRLTVIARNRADGHFDASLELRNTSYDGEDCVQLTISERNAAHTGSATDAVTGMPVYEVFSDELQDVIQHGLGGERVGALLLVSLDRYHSLRNQHGLKNGNLLMSDLSSLLRSELKDVNYGKIADDIIACLVRDVEADAAMALGKSLCKKAVKRIVEINGQSQQYTISIAIAAINQRKLPDPAELLNKLYGVCEQIRDQTGNHGTGNDALFYQREQQRLERGHGAGELIEEALADQRLMLLFQPLVSLSNSEYDHYEVTIGLKDQQAGEISGMELLAIADEQGGDSNLDRWIVMEATKRLAARRKQQPNLRLLINISGSVLEDNGFLTWFAVALKAARLNASDIIFQFSEAALGKQIKPAVAFAERVRSLGSQTAIHHFGSTAHSRQLLKMIKPALAKLGHGLTGSKAGDREELQRLLADIQSGDSQAIVPDVDSAATMATLWQLGPNFIQGSYVHEPGPDMDYEFTEMA